MDVLKFPASNAALWHSRPTGSPVYVHATYYRLPFVILEERSVRLAQRFSQNHAESDYLCHLVASVSTDPDAEGIKVSIDHIDPKPNHEHPLTEDLILKCLVRKDSSVSASSDCFKTLIRSVREGCLGKNQYNLRDVMAGIVTCYNLQGQNHIVYCDIDIVLPNVVFKATPIQPIPILTTALSKNLAGPMSLSEVQREAKSGYLTMDQTHKLLLILASDPKAASLPLVGIWVSGVAMIHDPFVWRSCLNYQFSSLLKNRVCRNPEPFLIILYSSLRSKPEFYECVTSDVRTDLSFELYSCHEVIHLSKSSADRPASPLELELNLVNSGRKLTLFEAALETSNKNLDAVSMPSILEENAPRKKPTPQKTTAVQPSVSEITLLYDDCEPRPHPTAQSPYPSPQPFVQQPRPVKSKSKDKRKQSLKSPKSSASESQIQNNSLSPNSYGTSASNDSHQSLTDSHQLYDAPLDNSRSYDQLYVKVSPPRTMGNQHSNPIYGITTIHGDQPRQSPMHQAIAAAEQDSGNRGCAAYEIHHAGEPAMRMPSSNSVQFVHGASPALHHSSVQQLGQQGHQYHDALLVGQQSDGVSTLQYLIQSGSNHPLPHLIQGVQNNTPHGFSPVNMKHNHGDPRLKSPLASVGQSRSSMPSAETMYQTEHHASPRTPNHCGDGDVATPRASGVSTLYHSSSSQYSSPQVLNTASFPQNMSDSLKTQNCCCNCSVVSSSKNTPVQHNTANLSTAEETLMEKSADRQDQSELYAIVRQQDAQIRMLREQISLLLAKQDASVSIATADDQASAAMGNRSVGCNTSADISGQQESKNGSVRHMDKSVEHSNWPEPYEVAHNQSKVPQNQLARFNVFENPGHIHSFDYSNSSHSMNNSSGFKDHSEETSSLSFGEFDMNKVHDNSQESVASTMVLDLPEYGPVSPDRSVFNNHSPEGSEIGDISPVPSESVSTCENLNAYENLQDEQVAEDSRDTGLGESNVQASLLLNDHRRFYKNVLENVYKHFLVQDHDSANDTVVSAPDLPIHHREVDECVQRSYDDFWATPLKSPQTEWMPPHNKSKQPTNVAKVTKEALAKLGIQVEKREQSAVKTDRDSVYLDLAQLPRVEYMTASLDTDSECSVEMDVLAMKYLKDDQLAELAKSKGRRQRINHIPTTPSKAGSVSNMSLASKKYLERYGILDNDNQSAITAVTDHSLRLPTLFNVHAFLQKLSETSSVVSEDCRPEVSRRLSTGSGSDHSRNSRQSSSCKDVKSNQQDPSQMTLNEMGQFLGLSKVFKARDNTGPVSSSSSPNLGHFPSR